MSNGSRWNADDDQIWDYALQNGFVIVSKDNDFYQRGVLPGHPPKFI
jgi:predicted nuclease of predicted toxin-antitoxin system